jgi:hypothetical protein
MSEDSVRTIAEFDAGDRATIRAALTVFRGQPRADVRVFHRGRDGSFHPTPRGLSIDRALLPELEKAVTALRQAAESEAA